MQLTTFLTTAFTATALAATFENVKDTSCQKYGGESIPISAAQLQDIILKQFDSSQLIPEASRGLNGKNCPSNTDDTYKWLAVAQWQADSPWPRGGGGGSIAVVYYKEKDTYRICSYLAGVQRNNYAGSCR